MKRFKAPIALIILIALLLSQVSLAGRGEEEGEETIYISSPEDLYQLAKKAVFDYWSQGKTIVLTADIDLGGRSFIPIPIFRGTFDGQGHSIRGLSIREEGSKLGLFRYLEEDGIIRNLRVEGGIRPKGDKDQIGGLVGNNQGSIEDCSFTGYVNGREMTGGLVGLNGPSGRIINSTFSGLVYGENKIGGIAGYNGGSIIRSRNEASVNTSLEEDKIKLQELSLDDINLFKSLRDASDIGGIAGINTGVIQTSENHGPIGYPNVGYNIGGIAGRQKGYINQSINYGKVHGRKEVGGIVGQMEPFISQDLSPSHLTMLNQELGKLQRMINNFFKNNQMGSQDLNDSIGGLEGDIKRSRDHIEALVNQTEDLINKDVEEINRIGLLAVEALDRIVDISQDFQDLRDGIKASLPNLDRALDYMASSMGELPIISSSYGDLTDKINYSKRRMEEAEEERQKGLDDLRRSGDLLYRGDWRGSLRLVKSSWKHTKNSGYQLGLALRNLKDIKGDLDEIIKSMGYLGGDMAKGLDQILILIDRLEDMEGDINKLFTGLDGLLDYMAKSPSLEFQTTDQDYQISKDGLFSSMDDLTSRGFQLVKLINSQGNIFLSDMEKISNQLFLVMDLLLGLVEDLAEGEGDLEDLYEDISREEIEGLSEGKLARNINYGQVEGDLNVGGIAGAMGLEIFQDPEEDLDINLKASLRSLFKTRALIYACENRADIGAKKNNVGGIVGKMDLGYIKDSLALGQIESQEGNYIGGIGGRSQGGIDSSRAKVRLVGGKYIGGIAGLAKEITNSYSLVEIEGSRTNIGAIAGNVEKDSIIKNNYFSSPSLEAIDGISYKDRAEKNSYEDLIGREGIGEEFKKFNLSFWADDKLVSSLDFNYGDTIAKDSYPSLPEREGFYASWENFDNENLVFDRKVRAEYTPYLSVLESREKREDILALILVEGSFLETDRLVLEELVDMNQELPDQLGLIEAWRLVIPEDGASSHTIRFMPEEMKKNQAIYLRKAGVWQELDFRRDGKYYVFDAEEKSLDFSLVRRAPSLKDYYLPLLGLGLLILLFLGLLIRRRRKRKRAARANI